MNSESRVCPSCERSLPADARFCGHCGTSLATERACAACGRANAPEMRFCLGCGARLEGAGPAAAERSPRDYTPRHLAERILTTRAALEGERKHVTVLFCDVQRSVQLSGETDPEDWHRIMDRFLGILAEGVHRFEGTVNQYTGDGIMALFGAPIAHEDHAQRACFAALWLRDHLRAYADELRLGGLNLSVRTGLNTGEVVVGKIGDDLRMDYTAHGQTVGLAARMESLAEAGRIYLTQTTAHLVDGYFRLRDLGRAQVKGAAEPIGVFELEDVGALRTRLDASRAAGFTRFVGRQRELEQLERALDPVSEGQGQLIGVVGEAGVGKSRLCEEFSQRCRARGIAVWKGHCPPHGPSLSYVPALELMRDFFGIEAGDAADAARRKIAGRLILLDDAFRDDLPLMFDFMGVPDPERSPPDLDPAARRVRLLASIQRIFQARSAREPAVVLLDDLHWIDPDTAVLLEALVGVAATTRTLLLGNFRPEYDAAWLHRADYQQIALRPLGPEATDVLLAELLGPDPSLDAIRRRVAQRAGGNPFFAEELVRELVESGQITGRKGGYRSETGNAELHVPETVHGVLAARIDRLAEREKDVLQTAAVIGPDFGQRLLETVCARSVEDVDAALRELTSAQFVMERCLFPEREYGFVHPLTQEVAYASQLTERKQRIHAAIARALEGDEARREENALLIAQHYERAREPGPALHAYARAARLQERRTVEACARAWLRVWTLADEVPASQTRDRTLVEAGLALMGAQWWGVLTGVEDAFLADVYARTRALALELGDEEAAMRAQLVYALVATIETQDPQRQIDMLEDVRRRLPASGHEGLRVMVMQRLGWAWLQNADLAQALHFTDTALALLEQSPGVGQETLVAFRPFLFAPGQRGCILARMGRLGDGRALVEDSLGRIRDYHDDFTLAFMLGELAFNANLRGAHAEAQRWARQGLELAERTGTAPGRNGALSALAVAHVAMGDPRAALVFAKEALERPPRETLTTVLAPAVEAHVALGDRPGARRTFQDLVEWSRSRVMWLFVGSHTAPRARRLAYGVEAAETIARELAEAEAFETASGARTFLALVYEEQAELAALLGDGARATERFTMARDLFAEVQAPLRAAQLAERLRALRGSS